MENTCCQLLGIGMPCLHKRMHTRTHAHTHVRTYTHTHTCMPCIHTHHGCAVGAPPPDLPLQRMHLNGAD